MTAALLAVRELARTLRHAHRPWRIVRWRDGRAVVFALDTAACPRCAQPLAEIRIPDRLYRRIPGAPVVFVPWQPSMRVDDDPPF